MKLIAGLGNPGKQYNLTRHNIGFMAVDAFASAHNCMIDKKQGQALVGKTNFDGESLLLVKPQTYMNLSGQSLIELMNYYKIDCNEILIVHDDVDQSFSNLKMQKKRGHGGHNGIRNIHQLLGHNDYARLKLGVGRSDNPRIETGDYVLQKFSDEQMKEIDGFLNTAQKAMGSFVNDGFDKTANHFNQSGL